jgi:hypothetical protein
VGPPRLSQDERMLVAADLRGKNPDQLRNYI